MPKIRDLGINVIPDMTRPPEIGYGGGCGPHTYRVDATCTATDTGFMQTPYPCPTPSNQPCEMSLAMYQQATCGATRVTGDWMHTCGATRVTCSGDYGMYTGGPTRVPWTPQCTPTVNCSQQQCTPTYGCTPTVIPCTPTVNDPSPNCHPRGTGGLTRESIAQLKAQLQQQIEALDEYAKSVGPKTAEEINAREKELHAELEELARRRKDLGK